MVFSAKERAFTYLRQEQDYYRILTKLLYYIPDHEFYGEDVRQERFRLYQEDITDLVHDVRSRSDSVSGLMLSEVISDYDSDLRRYVSVKRALFLFEILLQSRKIQYLTIKHLVEKYRLSSVLIKEYLK